MFDIEQMRKDREVEEAKLLERFGSRNPDMSDKCSRCRERYGDHYGTVSHLWCHDEWLPDASNA